MRELLNNSDVSLNTCRVVIWHGCSSFWLLPLGTSVHFAASCCKYTYLSFYLLQSFSLLRSRFGVLTKTRSMISSSLQMLNLQLLALLVSLRIHHRRDSFMLLLLHHNPLLLELLHHPLPTSMESRINLYSIKKNKMFLHDGAYTQQTYTCNPPV